MKPYQHVLIAECGESLVPLSLTEFAVVTPHPYVERGAPYGDRSPYWVRQSVATALTQAQLNLQAMPLGWRLQIFDAYRPLAVQQFMVDHTAQELAQQQGLDLAKVSDLARQALMEAVYQFWALPSADPKTPPPHSTGAAIDLTLVDSDGQPIDMGSPIDEVSARSHPDHFHNQSHAYSQQVHQHRRLLRQVMSEAGFEQHPNEWWHFSLGDQMWAWRRAQVTGQTAIARYGNITPAG
ncbi:M15 family metallopeptidase [Halomicronema sp. CCY15110]|uniref:M15 family metallopeptidase n=1 Tax=Halomicronema sp. CCY15110 TaxID=2767773 RepID=UPI001950BCA7|nr:M15 family metallopeptidase [Halomicronema sp. CCY15110]